jgi:hypothetical protein
VSRLDDTLTAIADQYADATVSFEAGKLILNKNAQQRKIVLVRQSGDLRFSSAPGKRAFGVPVSGAGTTTIQRFERFELLEATLRAADEADLDTMFDRFVNAVFEVFGPNAFEDVNQYEWFQGDSAAGGDWARRNPGIKIYFRVRLKSRSETSPYAVVTTATGSVTEGAETVNLPNLPAPVPVNYDPQLISSSSAIVDPPTPYDSTGLGAVIMPIGAFEPDDLVVIAVTNSRSLVEPIRTPVGWNGIAVSPGGTSGSCTAVFWRRMVADEPAVVTLQEFLIGVKSTWTAKQWIWRGTDPSKTPVAIGLLYGMSTDRTKLGPALTTGWGAVKTGWMQYIGLDRQDTLSGVTPAVTAFPAGYLDPTTETTHHTNNLIGGCAQGSCYKTENAASQAAGSWTFLPSIAGSIAPAFFCAIAVGGT